MGRVLLIKPVVCYLDQLILSKCNKLTSLKYYLPLEPPKTTILELRTRLAVCPKRASGDPLPSGPCDQLSWTGSKACMSLYTFPFSPLPPNIIIRGPARIAECAYLGYGAKPFVCGFLSSYYPPIIVNI